MQIGIDSFAAAIYDSAAGLTLSPVDRMHHLLEEIELADQILVRKIDAIPGSLWAQESSISLRWFVN